MEVTNSKPFEVVFTFVKHPYFGMLVEANAVQLLANGKPSLTYQRIREKTCDYYGLNDAQKKAVELIETFEAEKIIKRFAKTTKAIKPAEFFLKHFNKEVEPLIREFIEKQLHQILWIIRDFPLYWSGIAKEAMDHPVKFVNEPASVLFHFRRDETGTNYFISVKQGGEKVQFYQNESEVLTNQPAWLLTPSHLVFFNSFVDGKKIKPFLNKKFIHIDPHQEASYMEKFVKPLLENNDVYAVGFDIVTEQFDAQPILSLNSDWSTPGLVLYMRYGSWSFPYHVNKKVNVRLENTAEGFIFHRIRRSYGFEKAKVKFLNELGLKQSAGSLFSNEEHTHSYDLVAWINENKEILERNGFEIAQENSQTKFYLGPINLQVVVNNGIDWFDVKAIVKLNGFEIPFIKLRKHIIDRRREYLLPNGEIVILPQEWFDRFQQIVNLSEIHDDSFRVRNIHVSLLADLDEYLENAPQIENWAQALESPNIPDYELPVGFKATMRDYQLEGYRWIRYMHEKRFGALLADDMGLGKTVQTLAVVAQISQDEIFKKGIEKQLNIAATSSGSLSVVGPSNSVESTEISLEITSNLKAKSNSDVQHLPAFVAENLLLKTLIIAPKSLLYNWQSEAQKFHPGLNTILYTGFNRKLLQSQFPSADMIIMSYGTMRNDIDFLKQLRFQMVVLDESQAIKNPSSQTSRALLQLQSNQRIALTGTPIENTLLDIWSQMNFLNPGLLGSYTYFEKNFIRPIERGANAQKAENLRTLIDPFVLRRTKKQVIKELPPKIEKVHFCEMSQEQAELYESVKNQYRNEILQHVNDVGISRSRLKIFNGLMHLRQIALNPSLKNDEFTGNSGKDDEIMRMLLRAIENKHKVLLFSQFVGYLKIFEDVLIENQISYCYLDGSMDEKERQQQINLFQNESEKQVFLLSLRAGNSGLNLTAADYVFLADPWWNPFTMKQAEDRAHRIGQDKPVFSYKFITKNTIEEKILALQAKKAALAESIIPDEDSILASLNIEELEDLLN